VRPDVLFGGLGDSSLVKVLMEAQEKEKLQVWTKKLYISALKVLSSEMDPAQIRLI
jgi:hypothetical protein